MSKTIDIPDDLSSLDEEDLKYLHDRGRITDEQLAQALDTDEDTLVSTITEAGPNKGVPLEETPNTGDANTAGLSKEAHDRQLARMAKEQGSDVDDDDEPLVAPEEYRSVKNDLLRAEIARRNEGRDEDEKLSLDGNKEALATTLEEDDAAEEDEE